MAADSDVCDNQLNEVGAESSAAAIGSCDPRISFIIPVYNAMNYLGDCLDSIIGQLSGDFEIICVDDGSTDGSSEVLERYAKRYSFIRWKRQDNKGQGAARNVGLSMAGGKYIQFVDSDDCLDKNYWPYICGVIAENPEIDAIYYDGYALYENEELERKFRSFESAYKRESSHEIVQQGRALFNQLKKEKAYRVSPCMAVYRRDYLLENDIDFPEGIIYEDNVFTLKAICLAKHAKHLNIPLYCRRVREGSTMTTPKTAHNCRSYLEVYLEMLSFYRSRSWDLETSENFASEMRGVLKQVQNQYKKLDADQQTLMKSLPPTTQTLMDILVEDVNDKRRLSRAKADLAKAKRQIESMKKSKSWRIGRCVTAPLRLMKRFSRRFDRLTASNR